MSEFTTDQPRRGAKALGVLLAGCVAVGSLVLLAVTQEPKKTIAATTTAKAAIVPQIADAKSEAEIPLRGKSFVVLRRPVALAFSGDILSVEVREGQHVNDEDTLATYSLDRESLMHVHSIMYPERVLTLQNSILDQEISLEKLKKTQLPIRELELDKAEKELVDTRELVHKGLAQREALTNREREVQRIKRQILEIKESMRQTEGTLAKTREDLKFFEGKHKRDLDLLEWQTKRSYSNSSLPLEKAFLKAPISGQVIWIAPELRVKAAPGRGFLALQIAPTNPMMIRCRVHELDLVKLKTGDRGTVVFDAIPEKKFPCKVSSIPWVSRNPALDVPADYELECTVENPDGQIKDGLTCNVRMSVAQ